MEQFHSVNSVCSVFFSSLFLIFPSCAFVALDAQLERKGVSHLRKNLTTEEPMVPGHRDHGGNISVGSVSSSAGVTHTFFLVDDEPRRKHYS
jgi:hypothetical protein